MDDSSFTFFGRDLEKIPCFKKTFTYGICSGLMAGLGSFLFTSRIKRSSDIAVGTFTVVCSVFWVYCRYNWSKERYLTQEMNKALHHVMLKQGAKGSIPKEL